MLAIIITTTSTLITRDSHLLVAAAAAAGDDTSSSSSYDAVIGVLDTLVDDSSFALELEQKLATYITFPSVAAMDEQYGNDTWACAGWLQDIFMSTQHHSRQDNSLIFLSLLLILN